MPGGEPRPGLGLDSGVQTTVGIGQGPGISSMPGPCPISARRSLRRRGLGNRPETTAHGRRPGRRRLDPPLNCPAGLLVAYGSTANPAALHAFMPPTML